MTPAGGEQTASTDASEASSEQTDRAGDASTTAAGTTTAGGVNSAQSGNEATEATAGRSGTKGTGRAGRRQDDIQAAQAALEKAGIALQKAGEAVQNADSEEGRAKAKEALADARVAVIVAGEDLREAREQSASKEGAGGGIGGDDPFQEAEAALDEANQAIITASRAVLAGRTELPEKPRGDGTGGKTGQLDEELDESLAIFEDKIQDARKDVIDGTPPPAEGKSPAEETVAIGQAGTGQQTGTEEEEGDQSTQEESDEGKQRQTGRMPGPGEVQTAGAPTQPPEDIPDGQDDDIVAQQLREAAMAETDPELREKLWEEYRRYKEGLSK